MTQTLNRGELGVDLTPPWSVGRKMYQGPRSLDVFSSSPLPGWDAEVRSRNYKQPPADWMSKKGAKNVSSCPVQIGTAGQPTSISSPRPFLNSLDKPLPTSTYHPHNLTHAMKANTLGLFVTQFHFPFTRMADWRMAERGAE